MAYNPTNWQNETTPVNATNLNKLEQAVSDNSDLLDGLTSATLLWQDVDNMVAIEADASISVDLTEHAIIAILIYQGGTASSSGRGCIIAPVLPSINVPYFVQSGTTETGYVRMTTSRSGISFAGAATITASVYAIYGL